MSFNPTTFISDFLLATGPNRAMRGPPGMPLVCSTTGDGSNTANQYQAPEAFQLGEVVHVPQMWDQPYSDSPDQISGVGLTGASFWNSWTLDPIADIDTSGGSLATRITKNTPVANDTYFIEYWYAAGTQNPLLADLPGTIYKTGDAQDTPQNVFDAIQLGGGLTDPSFPVKGYKLGTPIPASTYAYQLRAYLARITWTLADASTKERYMLVFVPLDTTGVTLGYAKILSRPDSSPISDQVTTSSAAFDAQFNIGSIEPSIPAAEFDQTSIIPDALRIIIKSKVQLFSPIGAAIPLPGAVIEHANSATLDPLEWPSGDSQYYALGLVSPQAQLECWISHLNVSQISVVYRAIVRGWVVRKCDGVPPTVADIFMYQMLPPVSPGGLYVQNKFVGISGTASSNPAAFGVTYVTINELKYYRQPIDRQGNPLPQTIINNTPDVITFNCDTASDLVGTLSPPVGTKHMKVQSIYTASPSGTIYGKMISTLVSTGSYRSSCDEGDTYTAWQSSGTTNPYIDPTTYYLGTGSLALVPGWQSPIGEVSENTFTQPGAYKTDPPPADGRKLANDFLEIALDIN